MNPISFIYLSIIEMKHRNMYNIYSFYSNQL